MHPRGEELLYLLSGSVDVVLEYEVGERIVALVLLLVEWWTLSSPDDGIVS
jgi:hypothetical protein